uniref:Uncharacterized protein n=1 Tax=Parascaris univalens TaxID=6257 RepID=A0A915ABW1_PARUN
MGPLSCIWFFLRRVGFSQQLSLDLQHQFGSSLDIQHLRWINRTSDHFTRYIWIFGECK